MPDQPPSPRPTPARPRRATPSRSLSAQTVRSFCTITTSFSRWRTSTGNGYPSATSTPRAAVRDPRGFALKFYTTEGNYDLVGNTPIFFIRDPMKFPHFIRSQKRQPDTGLRDNDMQWDFWTLNPESAHQVTFLFTDRGTPRARGGTWTASARTRTCRSTRPASASGSGTTSRPTRASRPSPRPRPLRRWPRTPTSSYTFDGAMAYHHKGAQPVYSPNSAGGPVADEARGADAGWGRRDRRDGPYIDRHGPRPGDVARCRRRRILSPRRSPDRCG